MDDSSRDEGLDPQLVSQLNFPAYNPSAMSALALDPQKYPTIVMPAEPTLYELLVRISGTEELTTIKKIKLRVIARDISLQRLHIYTPNLRELRLDGSYLTSLRDLGCSLVNLRVLRVSSCGLDSLDGTNGLSSLRELYAEYNKIDDVSPCTSLPKLSLLNLKRNAVTDITYLGFLTLCGDLKRVVLEGCPAAADKNYRQNVKRLLPDLISLDGVGYDGFQEEIIDIDDAEPNIPVTFPPKPSAVVDEIRCSSRATSCSTASSISPNISPRLADTQKKCPPIFKFRKFTDTTPACLKRDRNARPSTAEGVPVKDSALGPRQMMRTRPHSVHPTSEHDLGIDDNTLLNHAFNSIGNLEPGQSLCGNLATALRNRKKKHEAWTDPVQKHLINKKMDSMLKGLPSWLDNCRMDLPIVGENLNDLAVGDGPVTSLPIDEVDDQVDAATTAARVRRPVKPKFVGRHLDELSRKNQANKEETI